MTTEEPQNELLRAAMSDLGYTRNQMCERMGGLSRKTFDKWMDLSRKISVDVRAHVREILEHEKLKRAHERLKRKLEKAQK